MECRTTIPRLRAAIFVVALALAGCDQATSTSPSLSSSPGSSPIPAESASASAAPSESPSAAPAEPSGPFDVAWARVEGLEPDASVAGVSFVDGRWFALGSVLPEAAIWSSDDGRSWTRTEIASTRAEDEITRATSVTELDGTLVAIGSFGMTQTDQVAWMTWTSDDGGATWTERRDGPSPYALHAIVAGGPGLVAAGWTYSGTHPYDSFIAVSSDGISWELTEAVLPNAEVQSLAVLDDRIVAVGREFMQPADPLSAAWYSDDEGATWSPAELPDAGTPSETVYEVLNTDAGLVAIGGSIAGAVAWLSADGATWERIDIVDGAEAHAIAVVDGGLVAVGNVAGQDFGPELSWTSPDGRTWEAAQQFDDGSVQILAADGEGATVVAGGQCLGECGTVLWVGEVSNR